MYERKHMSDALSVELSVREVAVICAILGSTDAARYQDAILGAADMPMTKAESLFGQTANIDTREDVAVYLRLLSVLDGIKLKEAVE